MNTLKTLEKSKIIEKLNVIGNIWSFHFFIMSKSRRRVSSDDDDSYDPTNEEISKIWEAINDIKKQLNELRSRITETKVDNIYDNYYFLLYKLDEKKNLINLKFSIARMNNGNWRKGKKVELENEVYLKENIPTKDGVIQHLKSEILKKIDSKNVSFVGQYGISVDKNKYDQLIDTITNFFEE